MILYRGVTRLDGTQGKKSGAHMFELEVFRKQMYLLKKVLVTLLGLFGAFAVFRRPHSDSATG